MSTHHGAKRIAGRAGIYFAAIVLGLVGIFFLLSNLGVITVSLIELVGTWWPVVLIVVGLMLFFTPNGEKKPSKD